MPLLIGVVTLRIVGGAPELVAGGLEINDAAVRFPCTISLPLQSKVTSNVGGVFVAFPRANE